MTKDEVTIGMWVRFKAVAGRSVGENIMLKSTWYPVTGLTGRVEKVFQNGKVAVAVDQTSNKSDDRKKTMHFAMTDLEKVTS